MTKVERKNSLLAEEMTLKYKFLIFPADENSGVYQGFLSLRRKGQKMEKNSVNYKYLVRSPRDIDWGITVDTVGSEPIPPNYPMYPPRTGHPDAFYFTPSRGRVLDSYQLLYITHGKGYFYTSPDTFIEIKEGDILILQPHVWHSYFPDKKTGWQEYWIGFQGNQHGQPFSKQFFAKDQIVYHIGVQDSIVKLYEQAIQVAMEEKSSLPAISGRHCQSYLRYDHVLLTELRVRQQSHRTD